MKFRPKILDALKGYDKAAFFADVTAGATVGVIALPLAIGFAIASGVTPVQGIWTAIVAGLLISLLGGTRVQIGGPTGAFVPILVGIVAMHGYAGLALATVMAGVLLLLMGALRLGSLIKFIPYPVTAGFTSGIAVIIFVGQLKEFFGLKIAMPSHTPFQAWAVLGNLSHVQWQALLLGALACAIIIFWPRKWHKIPPSIVAIIIPTALVMLLGLNVETIGTKFHGIQAGFPGFATPAFTFEKIESLMMPALTIAMLGAVESLLSAIVADGMTDMRHDSNQELMAQGLANIVTPFFGGIPATGAIARTAANIRSGGRTPVAGIVHSLTLLSVTLVAAPLAKFIPLAALSAVLLVVAYRMAEWENFEVLFRGPKSDFGVLLASFGLTVVFDLTVAVGVGLLMAAALFVRRMEEITHIRLVTPENDLEEGGNSIRNKEVPEDVVIYRIEGPFFFGAAEKLENAVALYAGMPRAVIFRMSHVPAMDATGLRALEILVRKFHRMGVRIFFSGLQPQPMEVLFKSGFVDRIGLHKICGNVDAAIAQAKRILSGDTPGTQLSP